MTLAPPLDLARAEPYAAVDWCAPEPRVHPEPPAEGGRWFLGPMGACVDRSVCGTGNGVRLAVIEDDTADFDRLELERLVPIEIEQPASGSGHGALMVAWASGAVRVDGSRFVGVAPDASVRVYCIGKAGTDVVSFPLALLRAASDGADVIVCATYVEATTSPMLDDALQAAVSLGRGGRGTAIILPTGRETSSPEGSIHASLSLALGDPASDPRVHCAAPSGSGGGWFLWRDSHGTLRPFANRGPAVRWLAPGDDLGYPFAVRERLFHAESSGASAVAAGVVSLVLSRNPSLSLSDLHALLELTADTPEPMTVPAGALADPADVLPNGRDRDGHDAKCGYGRLNATRACVSATDPFALSLVAVGEDDLAAAWCRRDSRPYSAELARWTAKALVARRDLQHGVRAVVRHLRLVARSPSRAAAHAPGALARQLGLLVRELSRAAEPGTVRDELEGLFGHLARASAGDDAGATFDRAAAQLAADLARARA
jgi:hypothetical protein